MKRRLATRVAPLALVTLLVACGGGGAATPAPGGGAPAGGASPPAAGAISGDPAAGQQLYIAQGCGGCHTIEGVEGAVGQVCPNHTGLATKAEQEIQQPDYTGQAQSAADYIRESIVDPNVFIVEGFQPNVMPQNYKQTLTEQQINDLVAFLMQQK